MERRYLVKKEGTTDPNYGKPPTSRTVEELLRYGVVNLDKPPGPTSHEVVAWVKKLLNVPRAGHGGTLEPS
ncbi:MAG: tRNA pseudouridine synthase A [Sulfolobales archaeon]|nr:tRNA pseudouridine synthase A [Sulfolobales archaeon]